MSRIESLISPGICHNDEHNDEENIKILTDAINEWWRRQQSEKPLTKSH